MGKFDSPENRQPPFDTQPERDNIAGKFAQLHNLDRNEGQGLASGTSAHDRLLSEITGYFQEKAQEIQASHNVRDPRSEIGSMFSNVGIQLSDYHWMDKQHPELGARAMMPYEIDPIYKATDQKQQQRLFVGDSMPQNSIPVAFQVTDHGTGLTFTIPLAGGNNADYLYNECKKSNVPLPAPYQAWTQYWGGKSR